MSNNKKYFLYFLFIFYLIWHICSHNVNVSSAVIFSAVVLVRLRQIPKHVSTRRRTEPFVANGNGFVAMASRITTAGVYIHSGTSRAAKAPVANLNTHTTAAPITGAAQHTSDGHSFGAASVGTALGKALCWGWGQFVWRHCSCVLCLVSCVLCFVLLCAFIRGSYNNVYFRSSFLPTSLFIFNHIFNHNKL